MITDDPVEDFHRLLHDGSLWHDDDDASLNVREVQGGKFGGTKGHFPLHEVLLQHLTLITQGIGEAHTSHTLWKARVVRLYEHIIHKHKPR